MTGVVPDGNAALVATDVEQHHRKIKRRIKPMLNFKSSICAAIILGGIEMIAMMRQEQADYARNPSFTLKDHFDLLAEAI